MKLLIVRHGETVANKKDISQGQTDGKLTREEIEKSELAFKHKEVINDYFKL